MATWDTESFAKRLSTHSVSSADDLGRVQSSTTVSPSQGFHITSTTKLSGLASVKHCFVGSLQLVPPDFIVDEYELSQRYQEGYGPLCHTVGETDLELPVQAVGNRSAAILAEVSGFDSEMEINIPLHLRYPYPRKDVELVELRLPWPWTVIACGGEPDGRQLLGQIFNNETITTRYTLFAPPGTPHPSSHVLVPTGNTSHQLWVETGTLLSVLLAFLYVAWSLQKSCRTPDTKIKQS